MGRKQRAVLLKHKITQVKLCVDICKRNGKKKLLWLGDKKKSLSYSPKFDEMIITVHSWFASKSCPCDWLYSRLGKLADEVTEQLGGSKADKEFRVKVGISDLNIRKSPGTDHARTGKFTGKGDFTIVEVKSGKGSVAGWGKLKSGAGWLALDNVKRL